jgi:hypothetical protein
MENGTLNEYLKREFPQLSDRRKLDLVGIRLSHCQFVLIHDLSYSKWLLVLAIVRPIVHDVEMTPCTKDFTSVHGKDIAHGDLTPVGLVPTQYMAEFNELLAEQYFA